jgi:hypothetical protein
LATLIALAALVALRTLYGSIAKILRVAGIGNINALWVAVANFGHDVFAEIFLVAVESEELFARGGLGEVNHFEHFFETWAGSLLGFNVHRVHGRSHGVLIGREAGGDFTGNGEFHAGRSYGDPFGSALFASYLEVLRSHLVLETGRIGASLLDFGERKVRATSMSHAGSGCHEGDEYVLHFRILSFKKDWF